MSVGRLNQVRNQQRKGNDTPVDRMDMGGGYGMRAMDAMFAAFRPNVAMCGRMSDH